jgi:uncharacterized membrane protein YhaH (DUF805 family)
MDVGKLFGFDGRIGRGGFWLITIVTTLAYIVGYLLLPRGTAGVAIGLVLMLISFVVSLATQTKRWHDRNKSGWWWLISFVPLVGGLWALIELGFLGGTPDSNRFGMPSSGDPRVA